MNLKLLLVGALERTLLDFAFRVDEGYDAGAGSKHQLRLIRKDDLNHFVTIPKQDSFLRTFPFLDICEVVEISGSLRHVVPIKIELHRSKLRIPF